MTALDDTVATQVAIEARFWSTDPFERPGADTLENLLNKMQDAAIFMDLVRRFDAEFRSGIRLVELGGGQGWASCLVKRRFPTSFVTLTDAVPEAVAGLPIWERVMDCRLDRATPATAQHLAFDDAAIDVLFCFAAAHHFVDHAAALGEAKRVLAPGGVCLWLYEPTSPGWLQSTAERRVNRKRPDVPEHVLVPATVRSLAQSLGLECDVQFSTSTAHRGRGATLYYTVLDVLPFLTRLLPCTAHFIFRRARVG